VNVDLVIIRVTKSIVQMALAEYDELGRLIGAEICSCQWIIVWSTYSFEE